MLDTNIVIYAIKNRPAKLKTLFKQNTGQMCISSVTFGELVYGAEKSTQIERNLADIEAMAARLEIMPFDTSATIHFGQLRAELAKSGKQIGPYDLMIAGHARSLGFMMVTNNTKEFKRVPGLRIENWI